MASSSQIRKWWEGYQHAYDRYVTVRFPGEGRYWNLRVADRSAPVWDAVSQIMESEPYLFLESAGGTYSKREPGSNSLHTYALALDLNPSKNPHRNPLQTDMPSSFIARIEGIRANGKPAVTWGGRWTAPSVPDAMHYQINVAPADCRNVTWDDGTPPPPDEGDDDMPTADEIAKAVWAATPGGPDAGSAWQNLIRVKADTDKLEEGQAEGLEAIDALDEEGGAPV